MYEFLQGLLVDLAQRCVSLNSWLRELDNPAITDHSVRAYRRLEQARRECLQILHDSDFSDPDFRPIFQRQYKRLKEDVELVENFIYPFVSRYNSDDQKITALCAMLTSEVHWPLPTPLVGAFSTDYYWTIAESNTICVPAAEATTLLGLGDLGHELGHILHSHHQTVLEGEFRNHLRIFIDRAKEEVRLQQRSQDINNLYERLYADWLDTWIQEFISDMIGTYLFGAAFGWQHIRLCAGSQSGIYFPSLGEQAVHPADEARLRGVVAVLNVMGHDIVGDDIKNLWNNYMGQTTPPPGYLTCYPQNLIEELAANIVRGCQNLGIRDFTQISTQPEVGEDREDLVSLVNRGWALFLNDPQNYHAWENQTLDLLWRQIGL